MSTQSETGLELRIRFKPLFAPYQTLIQYLKEGETGIASDTLQIIRRVGDDENNGVAAFQVIGGGASLIDPSTQKIFTNLLPAMSGGGSSGINFFIADSLIDLNLMAASIKDLAFVIDEGKFYTYQIEVNSNYNTWVKLDITSDANKDKIIVKTVSGILTNYAINVIEYTNTITQMQLPQNPAIGDWVKILVKQPPTPDTEIEIDIISDSENIFYSQSPFTIDSTNIVKFTYIDSVCGWMVN